MNTFSDSGLQPNILKAIAEIGFVTPTPVQQQTLPILLSGSGDLVALAQTGTGKTAAFGLPMLNAIDVKSNHTQAMILCPTRELCLQITNDLNSYSKYLPGVAVTAIYGGAPIGVQARQLSKGSQVVVGTPGRVVDMINRGALKLDDVSVFVLDEADEMLNMGFKDDLELIFKEMPAQKRTWLFSATMPPRVESIAKRYMHDAHKVSLGRRNEGASTIDHEYYVVQARDRFEALSRILDLHIGFYGVIFCRTRIETTEIAQKLSRRGYPAQAINGDMSQAHRDQVMGDFRKGVLRMLVATDVAARGLDVDNLTHVINYILPDDPEVYVHRSGRTGRAGKKGACISIVHGRELSRIRDIERTVGRPFELKKVPTGSEINIYHVLRLTTEMMHADTGRKKVDDLIHRATELFEGLSREEIIAQWVKWNYLRNEKTDTGEDDINADSKRPVRDSKQPRQKSEFKSGGRNERPTREWKANGNFTDLEVNIGFAHNLKPNKLMGIINDHTGDNSIQFGRIDIGPERTTFGVDSKRASDIVQALNGLQFGSKKLRVQPAGFREPRSTGFQGKKKKQR